MAASDATGRVKGLVKVDDKAMEGAIVLLAAREDSEKLANYRAFETDSDGSFDIRAVRSGNYYLFAVDAPDLEWKNPAVLRPYFADAELISRRFASDL